MLTFHASAKHSADSRRRLWNPEKGTLIKTYKGHSYEILDLDVIGDNSQIVSVGEDKQVLLVLSFLGRIHLILRLLFSRFYGTLRKLRLYGGIEDTGVVLIV